MNHLTLEQCQKLKEVGFPQDTYFQWQTVYESSITPDGKTSMIIDKNSVLITKAYDKGGIKHEEVACPILEELIEWVGHNLALLQITKAGKKLWEASNGNKVTKLCEIPLEAVYNLAINIRTQDE